MRENTDQKNSKYGHFSRSGSHLNYAKKNITKFQIRYFGKHIFKRFLEKELGIVKIEEIQGDGLILCFTLINHSKFLALSQRNAVTFTAKRMEFSVEDVFSKYEYIRSFSSIVWKIWLQKIFSIG